MPCACIQRHTLLRRGPASIPRVGVGLHPWSDVISGLRPSSRRGRGGEAGGADRWRLWVWVRAPMEHRAGVPPRSVIVIMVTGGLHRTPVSASEHRSSTGTSTCDRQRILSIAYVQVRGLLRVRRQGLEPRTRGLRARTWSYRLGSARAGSCRFRRSLASRGAAGCRPVSHLSTAAEHRWSTATAVRCSIQPSRRGSGADAGAANFRSAGRTERLP